MLLRTLIYLCGVHGTRAMTWNTHDFDVDMGGVLGADLRLRDVSFPYYHTATSLQLCHEQYDSTGSPVYLSLIHI